MTYPGVLDDLGNLDELLLVLGSILATDKNLDWNPSALDLIEVFRCSLVSYRRDGKRGGMRAPFFCVVMM